MTHNFAPSSAEVVKQCPLCRRDFTLEEVLESAEVKPIGMAFEPGSFEHNVYYFNHHCPGCGSTFVIPVERFIALIEEYISPEVLDGTAGCDQHCRRLDDLEACNEPCYYAPFRRFLLNRLLQRRPSA